MTGLLAQPARGAADGSVARVGSPPGVRSPCSDLQPDIFSFIHHRSMRGLIKNPAKPSFEALRCEPGWSLGSLSLPPQAPRLHVTPETLPGLRGGASDPDLIGPLPILANCFTKRTQSFCPNKTLPLLALSVCAVPLSSDTPRAGAYLIVAKRYSSLEIKTQLIGIQLIPTQLCEPVSFCSYEDVNR